MPLDPEHTISAVNCISCQPTCNQTSAQTNDDIMQQPNLRSAVMLQQPLTKVISCFVAKAHHVHRCAAYTSMIKKSRVLSGARNPFYNAYIIAYYVKTWFPIALLLSFVHPRRDPELYISGWMQEYPRSCSVVTYHPFCRLQPQDLWHVANSQ